MNVDLREDDQLVRGMAVGWLGAGFTGFLSSMKPVTPFTVHPEVKRPADELLHKNRWIPIGKPFYPEGTAVEVVLQPENFGEVFTALTLEVDFDLFVIQHHNQECFEKAYFIPKGMRSETIIILAPPDIRGYDEREVAYYQKLGYCRFSYKNEVSRIQAEINNALQTRLKTASHVS